MDRVRYFGIIFADSPLKICLILFKPTTPDLDYEVDLISLAKNNLYPTHHLKWKLAALGIDFVL